MTLLPPLSNTSSGGDGRIAALEERLAALERNSVAAEQKIFGLMQALMDGLKTLDAKTSAWRGNDFLEKLSSIYPKKKTVLFMGRSYFGDNIKYAFLVCAERAAQSGFTCYFLPADMRQKKQIEEAGLPCLPVDFSAYTQTQIEILLSAALLVLDEQFIPPNWRQGARHALLRGAKTVQLWHGIALKEIGLEVAAQSRLEDDSAAEILASCGPFDAFVAPAAASQKEWARKFAFRRFAPIGYPRDDVLFRDPLPRDLINVDRMACEAARAAKGKQTVILYAPTFRDNGVEWFTETRIAALADACAARDAVFFVNLHPGEQGSVERFRHLWPSIRFIEPQTDIYPVLKHTDLFITDYSSLAFDFLLLDRPILFYRPDHEAYISRARRLIPDHERYVCGPVSSSIEELIAQTVELLANPGTAEKDFYRAARQALAHELYDHSDGKAGERLCGLLIEMMKEAP